MLGSTIGEGRGGRRKVISDKKREKRQEHKELKILH